MPVRAVLQQVQLVRLVKRVLCSGELPRRVWQLQCRGFAVTDAATVPHTNCLAVASRCRCVVTTTNLHLRRGLWCDWWRTVVWHVVLQSLGLVRLDNAVLFTCSGLPICLRCVHIDDTEPYADSDSIDKAKPVVFADTLRCSGGGVSNTVG